MLRAQLRHNFAKNCAKKRPTLPAKTRFSSTTSSSDDLPKVKPRRRRALRGAGIILGAGLTFYLLDTQLNASAITRNLHTLYAGLLISADYKLNFNPSNTSNIPDLHERVAERLFTLITSNGGLYIKIGQAIGANSAVLPLPFQRRFTKLFDDAPYVPYHEIEGVVKREFGIKELEELFEWFETAPIASASIAQVHRARLRLPPNPVTGKREQGPLVAVKVQKPAVMKQVEWDLAGYRLLMWIFSKAFDLPVYFLADYISSRLRLELDFLSEATNATRTREWLDSLSSQSPISGGTDLSSLAWRVYIPRVYHDYTTKRVLTTEWIDGVRLSDKDNVENWVEGKPVVKRAWNLVGVGDEESLAPRRAGGGAWWKGGQPIKNGKELIMRTMVDLFSAQIFVSGNVHCDPHPGNILLRPLPPSSAYPFSSSRNPQPQLVLLDHGLYITLTPTFRTQYAQLWEGLFMRDFERVKEIAIGWGIGSADLFASATLMRPVRFGGGGSGERGKEKMEEVSQYDREAEMKQKLAQFLLDTEKVPKELVFIGRNMRIVQANNQALGSPVNRIRMMANWASRALVLYPPPPAPIAAGLSSSTVLTRSAHHLNTLYGRFVFLTTLWSVDFLFYLTKARVWWSHVVDSVSATLSFGKSVNGRVKVKDWEDEIEQGMRDVARETLGVEIEEGVSVFEG